MGKGKMKITIKIHKDKREKLEDTLKEVWELKNEHPDIVINVEVLY